MRWLRNNKLYTVIKFGSPCLFHPLTLPSRSTHHCGLEKKPRDKTPNEDPKMILAFTDDASYPFCQWEKVSLLWLFDMQWTNGRKKLMGAERSHVLNKAPEYESLAIEIPTWAFISPFFFFPSLIVYLRLSSIFNKELISGEMEEYLLRHLY